MARSSRMGTWTRAVSRWYFGASLAVLAACGSDRGGGDLVAGAGGFDGGAGASGGGGAPSDAGAAPPGNDAGGTFSTLDVELRTQACKDYVAAWCVRHAECQIWDEASQESCMQVQAECPERFFSKGTGYTVESLNACRDV